uniref:Protein OBERON 4 n=1 Tax=Anthurium amnicola TaxID=1678845 RepID=A0A1D1Z074_9ARAE
MKRPRSYGEDMDEEFPGEKSVFKDWGRRDPDPDRPPAHRRFYPKAETGGRKGPSSSSYDRPLDDDREPLSRSLSRKRFDHELEGFDRRKFGGGGFERYREEEERPPAQAASPRVPYGGDRIHRSDRFSLPSRRDYPKGFRSERERPRREGSSVSSWRRLSGGKDAADEEGKAAAAAAAAAASLDPVAGGGHRLSSEDRGKTKPKDSSSGDQPTDAEIQKNTQDIKMGNCSGSEMEEGELEPDPEPEPHPTADVKPVPASEDSRETETEFPIGFGESSESGRKSSNEKLMSDEDDASGGKEEGMVTAPDPGRGTDEAPCHENHPVNQEDENDQPEEQEYGKATTNATDGDRGPVEEAANAGLESPGHKQEGSGKEQFAEEEGKDVPPLSVPLPLEERLEEKENEEKDLYLELQVEVEHKEERCIDLEMEPKEAKGFDLETEAEVPMALFGPSKEAVAGNGNTDLTLKLVASHSDKDKGKSLAVSLSNEANSVDEEDAMEGPSSRGFELIFPSDITRFEKGSRGGIVVGKHKEAKLSLEPLDLSLSLPGVAVGHSSEDLKARPDLPHTSQDPRPRPTSPPPRSIQSLPSSFFTNSDGFTASISFSGSQQFVHNPSCSLTQNSMENYEHSVGSHPIFQGIDLATNGTIWQGQPSNESKCKGAAVPFYQRSLLNGKLAQHSSHAVNGLLPQSGLPRQLSPTNSHGSRDTRSEHSKKVLKRERSSTSLFRSEQQEADRIAFNGGVIERVVTKIVSEPLQMVSRMIQEMTEQSVAYLRDSISEMVVNRDKFGHLCALQEMLQKRSDLTLETLSKCHLVVLEMLVTLKTGLPDFLRRANNIPPPDLAEIFVNLKCRNLACRSILPVDGCDCKVCAQKNGFCSACMCLVCSKFDLASNTCSWVGCDVCLHWCHTDCALRDSYIRNGLSVTGAQGNTEIQFHCVACGHPSEMFGFVKEVFKTCAKDWKVEILAKELEYVRRIFCASEDSRGKRLRDVADQLLMKLQNKLSPSEVTMHILGFLAETDSNFSSGPSSFPQKDIYEKNAEVSNKLVGSSKETLWHPDASVEKSPRLENASSILPSLDGGRRRSGDVELQRSLEKQQVVDELDSVVKFKQAEAKMYQARADDARREAEDLKRIAVAKKEKIEEVYVNRIAKVRLGEVEEKRKQKFEELQALEQAHHEYFNMKIRMEADIKNLLLKMEATKRNFNT